MISRKIERKIVHYFDRATMPFARFSVFVVYFWFGILKVIGYSPASGVVGRLFESTIPFMSFDTFLIAFGVFECLIGTFFLLPRFEKIVIPLLFFHMFLTFGPLVFLPGETWQAFMVPTLEGQYIIKNLVIMAVAINVAGRIKVAEEETL